MFPAVAEVGVTDVMVLNILLPTTDWPAIGPKIASEIECCEGYSAADYPAQVWLESAQLLWLVASRQIQYYVMLGRMLSVV